MQRPVSSYLSIASWNINGIKNKIKDPDFLELLQPYDIIFLSETWIDKGEENISIDGFFSLSVAQSGRHKNAKHNSGGISVFIKNEYKNHIKILKSTEEHFIWLKINKSVTGFPKDTYCCGAYIKPHGSPIYTRQPDLDLFSVLSDNINKYKNLGYILCTGDLNARTGKLSDCPQDAFSPIEDDPLSYINIIDVPPRCSMDNEKNPWGIELVNMCFVHDLCLLNGRTLGDLKGQPTFFCKKGSSNSKNGFSVIDLSIVDKHLFPNILSFKVHPKNEFQTNHCLVETKIACKPCRPVNSLPPTNNLKFKKYSWNPDTSLDKLKHALQSPEVTALKTKITNNTYPTTRKVSTNIHLMSSPFSKYCMKNPV